MNIPHIAIFNKQGIPFSRYDNLGALLVGSCSWVSFLVSTHAIRQCGLPYREFNIWGDDMEYTQRLTRNGFLGLYVPSSVVHHKTPNNYSADIFTDNDKSIWKFRYGIRNHLFMVRNQKGALSYTGKLLKHFFVLPIKVLRKRKTHRKAFIGMIWAAAWESIFFRPKIESLNESHAH